MRLNKFLFLALFALVCFASQLRADVPPIIWYKTFSIDGINNLSLSPNGEYVAVGSQTKENQDASAMIINTADGSKFKSYFDYANSCECRFSPTGKYLLLAGQGFTIYDFETGDTVLKVLNDQSTNIAMSPDETKFIISRPGWIEFWDLETKIKIDSIPFFGYQNAPKTIKNISYSPDGKYIAYTIESSGTIELIDANTHQKRFSTASPKWYGRLRFSPNSKLLAFNSSLDSTAIEILNLDSMKVLDKVAGFIQSTADIIFTKDSKNILYTGLGSLAYLKKFNLNSKGLITISENWNGYKFLCLSNSNDTLFSTVSSILLAENISSYLKVEEHPISILLNININASQDTLNLSFTTTAGKEFTIRIVNIEGQIVKTFSGYSTSEIFSRACDISDLASGNYILSVQGSGINSSANFSIAR